MSQDPALHPTVARVTACSHGPRADYLLRMDDARASGPARARLICSNPAHGFAGAGAAGAIGRLREGDAIRIDAEAGTLDVLVDETKWRECAADCPSLAASHSGIGRELYALTRAQVGTCEQGTCSLFAHDRDPECAA